MPKIFISYRRSDTGGYAGRLNAGLGAAFGGKNVFMDLDDIRPGKVFANVISKAVSSHGYFLALIGDQWLSTTGADGRPRIFNPEDFVHKEIVAALHEGINVIPVLVKNAAIPTAAQLPEALKPLVDLQVHELSDSRWDYDVDRLIESLGGTRIRHRFRRSKWPRRLAMLAAFMAIIFGTVMFATRGVVDDADEFLTLLAQNDIDGAYALTTSAFRNSESQQSFEQYVTRLGLLDNASASWTSRAVENSKATLAGNITTKQRATIPLTMVLLKEDGMWRVLALDGAQAGTSISSGTLRVPEEEELRQLIKTTLLNFDRGVQSADFSDFLGTASQPLQRQVTSAELLDIFSQFVDNQISITNIREVRAVLDRPPAIDENGMLLSSGYFPTDKMNLAFEIGYLYEHPFWKLKSIRVRTLAPGELP